MEIGSGRQPSLCVDSNGNLVLTYLEGGEVYVRTSSDRDNKLHFDEPISISSLKGKSMQTMRRGPKIVSSGDALVVSAIMKTDDGNADLYVTRSIDHGTTWSESIRVNSVSNSAREGLHSMTSDGGNRIGIVWLDLRSEKTEVWCAISKDNGKTFGKDALVYRSPDGATCECCKPEINFDAMGRVNVMFRNHLGEVRDIYVATSDDGGETFNTVKKLGEGSFPASACPMDGGSLVRVGSKLVAVF
ncbi:MAG TPA: sialidase family protein [Tepidisphaeraceae bacterium]|nr:sialidase family protein [Tepidisphaeraceae bacterium]